MTGLIHIGNDISKIERADTRADRIEAGEKLDLPSIEGDFGAERFLDRESSWLDFNSRVLELAEDPDLYLLERLNFLSIVASNLDEFFMVRVAGLKRRIATGLAVPSAAGLSPDEQMEAISTAAHSLQKRHAQVFHEQILPELKKQNIHIVGWDDLDADAKTRLRQEFLRDIFPILTPLAVDPAHPFPYISGLSLNLAVLVRNPQTGKELFARVKVPDQLDRMISVDGPRAANTTGKESRYIPLEVIIAEHLDTLFPGMEVVEHHVFRVTRNEDLEVEEDDAENLLQALEKELLRRRFGPPVRLEVEDTINPKILDLLISELNIDDSEVYKLPAPLDLRGMGAIVRANRTALPSPQHRAPILTQGQRNGVVAVSGYVVHGAINGGKHVHDENVEYLKTKKLTIEMLGKNAQPFRINLDGEYGGDTPVELEVFHNHLEFFANIDEINNDALVHPSEE